jgi:hypothetical protein
MTDIQEQIRILVALQEVESEILKAGQHIAALNSEATSLGQAATEHEAQVAEQQDILGQLKKTYRELESESKDNLSKIEKSNEKLRAVKTNKEYQSILKEIEEIKKKNSDIEDRMIALLDQIESQEDAVKQSQTQLAGFVQMCNQKKTGIADQIQQHEQAVEQLNEKKSQIRISADPKISTILDNVKSKVRGMAVAPVEQAVCMGCHLNIPPQLYNELRRYDELRFCPHCSRIIYWKEKDND